MYSPVTVSKHALSILNSIFSFGLNALFTPINPPVKILTDNRKENIVCSESLLNADDCSLLSFISSFITFI